jgi:DNA-binding response OmpR family regulator
MDASENYNRVAMLARVAVGTHPSSMTRLPSAESSPPPRVLLAMPEQWPRALLRAALRENGYDAVGTRTLSSALRVNPDEPDRGPVRLVILDQSVLGGDADAHLAELLARNESPATILLARPTLAIPEGPWQQVLRRPVSLGEIVAAAQASLPLSPEHRRPLDA